MAEVALIPLSRVASETAEDLTLDDLIQRINEEAAGVRTSLSQSVTHAMACGYFLLEARKRIPHGEWETWLIANAEVSTEYARIWMRCYRHRDLLMREKPESIKAARLLMRRGEKVGDLRVDPVTRAEAQRLRTQGMTLKAIASEMGVHQSSVQRWVNPKAEEKYRANKRRRSKAGRSALQRENRRKMALQVGGDLGETYSRLRLTLDVAERATESATGEARQLLRAAMHSLYRAEDTIAKAMREAVR